MGNRNKHFDSDNQNKIISRYLNYFNKEDNCWRIPSHIFKSLIEETWNISKILNKYKDPIIYKKLNFNDMNNDQIELLKTLFSNDEFIALSDKKEFIFML